MPRLPDLEAMAIFAAVVEARGITAAASNLGLSAPTVSKALARLEQRIGAPLFHRSSRRLTLTEAGRDLAPRAARLLAEAEAAEAAMAEESASPRGLIRFTAPMSFGIQEVAPLLPEFLAAYPDIRIDMHLSDAAIDLIAEGYDLALRIGRLADSSLRARRLATIPRLAVASPAYLAAKGHPRHPSDLSGHACFGYAYLQPRDAWCFTNAAGETAHVSPPAPLRVNNGEAVLPALLAGVGIAELPEFLVRDALAEGTLQPILLGWTLPEAGLYLVTPPNALQPARVRVFVGFLVRKLTRKCAMTV